MPKHRPPGYPLRVHKPFTDINPFPCSGITWGKPELAGHEKILKRIFHSPFPVNVYLSPVPRFLPFSRVLTVPSMVPNGRPRFPKFPMTLQKKRTSRGFIARPPGLLGSDPDSNGGGASPSSFGCSDPVPAPDRGFPHPAMPLGLSSIYITSSGNHVAVPSRPSKNHSVLPSLPPSPNRYDYHT